MRRFRPFRPSFHAAVERLEDRRLLAVEPALVADLNRQPSPGSNSEFSSSALLGDDLYFIKEDANRRELWKTDGAGAETVRIAELPPEGLVSANSGLRSADELLDVDGTLFFAASSGDHWAIWTSDGTTAGTGSAVDIVPKSWSTRPHALTASNGLLYFVVADEERRLELWRSDGSAAGTFHLPGTYLAAKRGEAPSMAAIGESLWFVAREDDGKRSLWSTHGTPESTRRLVEEFPGDELRGGDESAGFHVAEDGVFFVASHDDSDRELWMSDGTPFGTRQVVDLHPGLQGSNPVVLGAIGGAVYFRADDGVNGTQLFKTDGTAAGTVQLTNLSPLIFRADPREVTAVGGMVFFTADNGVTGRELWKTDGTSEGTVQLTSLSPSVLAPGVRELTNVGGQLFFTAADGVSGAELWKSDGTAAGTVLVADLLLGPEGSNPKNLHSLNDLLLFTADGESASGLWSSDGTAEGTVFVADLNGVYQSSSPQQLTDLDGDLFFSADDGRTGRDLWQSDGTPDGTIRVKDFHPVLKADSQHLQSMIHVGGILYFIADDGESGTELWKSDGTPDGTVRLSDVEPGAADAHILEFTDVDGRLFFTAGSETNGRAVWTSDGTPEGTVRVTERETTFVDAPNELVAFAGSLYFVAGDSVHGRQIWRSNGTAEGTYRVAGLENYEDLYELTPAGNRLFFSATDAAAGRELWAIDGTEREARLVVDLLPGEQGSFPRKLVAADDRLFFLADAGEGIDLWTSDGTAAGTRSLAAQFGAFQRFAGDVDRNGVVDLADFNRLKSNFNRFVEPNRSGDENGDGIVDLRDFVLLKENFGASAAIAADVPMTAVGGELFFVDYDGALWKSDGSTAGTNRVIEVAAASGGGSPRGLTAVGDALLFFVGVGDEARQLWTSDGTADGTVPLFDESSGLAVDSSLLGGDVLVPSGDSLYFVAKDDRRGAELWSLDLADVAQDVASRRFALAPELAFAAAMPIGSAKFEPFDWLDDRS